MRHTPAATVAMLLITLPLTAAAPNTTAAVLQEPGITLTKTAHPSQHLGADFDITYDFQVTNSGDVPLTNITINELSFTGHNTLDTITCPAAAATLDPGETVTCHSHYTTIQPDVLAGTVTNTATASGAPADATPVSSAEATAVLTLELPPPNDTEPPFDLPPNDTDGPPQEEPGTGPAHLPATGKWPAVAANLRSGVVAQVTPGGGLALRTGTARA